AQAPAETTTNTVAQAETAPVAAPTAEPEATPVVVRKALPVAPAERGREAVRSELEPIKRAPQRERVLAAAPLPDGKVRAQYLGTTPDGQLVFGLPSHERGYLAPATVAPVRHETRRRIHHPAVRAAERPDEMRVLPALPPDE
ncbi:MAG: hypothetical protein M3Y86_10915, partial [Verrucomicrobiota bacterium]|nr:hypothetical protein [Verrucomicrobiota bacterium]